MPRDISDRGTRPGNPTSPSDANRHRARRGSRHRAWPGSLEGGASLEHSPRSPKLNIPPPLREGRKRSCVFGKGLTPLAIRTCFSFLEEARSRDRRVSPFPKSAKCGFRPSLKGRVKKSAKG